MRFVCLAVDYDGTIAEHGRVSDPTREALRAVRASGRSLVLVTGRELDDLARVFDELDLFDRVVAENGALLVRPESKEEVSLGDPPPDAFVEALRARDVTPLSVGRCIVATWEPNEQAVLDAIKELGLEMQVVFNKGAVMVLPAGVNKASGLSAALAELRISPHNVVGAGDAENDHAFLSLCGCSYAVANALPTVKERADRVTTSAHGDGVRQIAERLIGEDLSGIWEGLKRHRIPLGTVNDDELTLDPFAETILVAGPSGSGKSTFTMALLERLADAGYQVCVLDPEGDHTSLDIPVVTLGDATTGPDQSAVLKTLEQPIENAVVNMLGLSLDDRPPFGDELLKALHESRGRTGRPHWIVIDEAHHMLHHERDSSAWASGTNGALLITVHPHRVARAVLEDITTMVAVGEQPAETVSQFARALDREMPPLPEVRPGEALLWRVGSDPVALRMAEPRSERARHARKYAAGDVGVQKSFFFRGPDARLNLRAHNLDMFVRLADGVDTDTWTYHLRRGDYSRWIRDAIKDDDLADEVAAVERDGAGDGDADGRARVRSAIEARYTAPS